MTWETSLDRLVLQQIHDCERGDARPDDVRRLISDLFELAPDRAETSFHLGYGRSLLGLDLPEPDAETDRARRYYLFGRVRGHDRRGERNWVADLVTDPSQVLELLREPEIAQQAMPMALRTLCWSGEYRLAIHAIDFLANTPDMMELLVEAGMTDLLARLEGRVDEPESESTAALLESCTQLACFGSLPDHLVVNFRYELGRRLVAAGEFESARTQFEQALALATDERAARSKVATGGALASLNCHSVLELTPCKDRPGRETALGWLDRAGAEVENQVPEALHLRGLFAYEAGDVHAAAEFLDGCSQRCRRRNGRDLELLARNDFFLAASLLSAGDSGDAPRALRLMESALDSVRPDLETFYSVHEALKDRDRRLALRFLDAVDIGRGTASDQLLFVSLEYLALGEAQPAQEAAERVLEVAVDLDQRVEAMRTLLTACNMRGDQNAARDVFQQIRDLLTRRGAFEELESLLQNEEFVGQALDHLEIKVELVNLYEEMDDREVEKATLQSSIARSLRARKDVESLREAFGILREVEITFPELVQDDLKAVEKLLELADPEASVEIDNPTSAFVEQFGRAPRILVVGGNERQRRHHPRFETLSTDWGFQGEWLMANYSSPQKLVSEIHERIQTDQVDVLILLHWNRHETTEPALEIARKAQVPARTVHYAGFTSLQVALSEQLERLVKETPAKS
ncbi:MAG: hypothetical protein AAF196_11510 [Planctomycetota bacterium]